MRAEIGDKHIFSKILYDLTSYKIDPNLLNGITIDSREVREGDVFIALKGEHVDGHNFISTSLEKGALLVLNEEQKFNEVIKVDSCKQIINFSSMMYREKMECKVIGITGSNGKTTSKEILFHILNGIYNISCTKGNYNSTIGLPLSLFSISQSDDIFLAEMGTNQIGEIKFLCNVTKPDIGIITNIAEAHIENFNSINAIFEEKLNLFKSVKNDGIIFVNMDDTLLSTCNTSFNCKSIEYGFYGEYDYNAEYCDFINNNMKINGDSFVIPNLTKHLAKNILCSFSVASELGISKKLFKKKIKDFKTPEGRGNIINVNNYVIINDSYNSNYSSTAYGIESLNKFALERKIVVLGDMLELGSKSINFHQDLLQKIIENNIQHLFLYGEIMQNLYKATLERTDINIFYFKDQNKLIKELNKYIEKNDVIYVKGSRGMKMENIIKGIC